MPDNFEIVREREAERDRQEERDRFARQAPDAEASFEALEKVSKKPDRAIEIDDMPEQLRGKVHVERDGEAARVYTNADKSREMFTAYEDRLKSEKVDRQAIEAMVAVARHRDWDRIAVHGKERFRRDAWLEATARDMEVTGYNPTEKDIEAMESRRARYQAQEQGNSRENPGADKADAENVIEHDRDRAGAGRDADERDDRPASDPDKAGDLDVDVNRSGFRERDNAEELYKRQAIEAQIERNLRVKNPDNETLVEKGMERAREALDDLQRQGKALPEIKVDDRTVEKRIETQIDDRAQSGPTVDDMRQNIRQQERDRDKDIER